MEPIVKAACVLMALAFTTPAHAQAPPQALQVVGQAGYLGEWDFAATVAVQDKSKAQDYAGPLTMTHVGMCSQDGPEKKTGDMRFTLSNWTSRVTATLLIDGVTCTYSGKFSVSHAGVMSCPGRRPMPLTLWVKQ